MEYTWLQISWLFYIYSLAGWMAEVCVFALRKKTFINRGFVNGPFCPIYGFASTLYILFLPELTRNVFFLFLGGMILSTVLEYSTGVIMQKIFGRKLWDYSSQKWNLDGFICLKYSLIWGALAVLLMKFVNPLLYCVTDLIPGILSQVLVGGLSLLLAVDFISTALAVLGMQKQAAHFAHLAEGIQTTSRLLENALTKRVQSRMLKSFPSIDLWSITPRLSGKSAIKTKHFAAGCSFYKLVCLFFIGAFLGDIVETVFCLITMGELMSRSSVVYGPFSIVWGLGCAMLTALLYRHRNRSNTFIFLTGTLLGGAYEYICSVFTELVFGTVFWDYSGFSFNLGGRINLLYCFFWGFAAVVWIKLLYPRLSLLIERIPMQWGAILCNCLIIFMIFNMIISGLALTRYTERNTPGSGQSVLCRELSDFLDRRFGDARMARIYPNAKVVIDGVPQRIAGK